MYIYMYIYILIYIYIYQYIYILPIILYIFPIGYSLFPSSRYCTYTHMQPSRNHGELPGEGCVAQSLVVRLGGIGVNGALQGIFIQQKIQKNTRNTNFGPISTFCFLSYFYQIWYNGLELHRLRS